MNIPRSLASLFLTFIVAFPSYILSPKPLLCIAGQQAILPIQHPPDPAPAVEAAVIALEATPTPTPTPEATPPPAPPPPPPSTDYKTVVLPPRVENWDGLLQQHFGAVWWAAKQVMLGESSGNSNNIGDRSLTYWQNGVLYGYSVGLMQIRQLPGRPSTEQLLDPAFNISYAATMQRSSGWCPWTAAKKLGYC